MSLQNLLAKPDRVTPIIDLLVEQHQNGAPDGVIRLTGRMIQGEVLREVIETWKPMIDAAREMRACFDVVGTALFLKKSGLDLEKAAAAFDAAMAKIDDGRPVIKGGGA